MTSLPTLLKESDEAFEDNPLFRSGGFYPFKHDVKSFIHSQIEAAYKAGLTEVKEKCEGMKKDNMVEMNELYAAHDDGFNSALIAILDIINDKLK